VVLREKSMEEGVWLKGKVSEKIRSTKNADNEGGVWCRVAVEI
jgi:hypothetical protein